MRWLLFLSRLAFICGIFFLLSVSLLIYDWAKDDAVTSTIVMIGYVMGMAIVPVVVISYLIILFLRRKLTTVVPLWLVVANTLFLFILLFYIFYVNDPYYNKR